VTNVLSVVKLEPGVVASVRPSALVNVNNILP